MARISRPDADADEGDRAGACGTERVEARRDGGGLDGLQIGILQSVGSWVKELDMRSAGGILDGEKQAWSARTLSGALQQSGGQD